MGESGDLIAQYPPHGDDYGDDNYQSLGVMIIMLMLIILPPPQ